MLCPRIVTTLHIGRFYAREVILVCSKCDCKHRCEQLCNLVPPGANFGYDVLVYVGKALYIRHRSEEEVVAELAETPLVNNLQNPEYMKILLKKKTSLEEVFAEIEIDTLRDELRKAQFSPEKIPIKIKRLIAMPDYPEKLMKMVEKAVALS